MKSGLCFQVADHGHERERGNGEARKSDEDPRAACRAATSERASDELDAAEPAEEASDRAAHGLGRVER